MSSIFTKIVRGEIPCYKVAESEDFIAFLDVRPLVKGHTLVIPKKEINYIFDMDDVLLANLFVFAKKVAKVLEAEISCVRIGISVIGLEVPHTHVHLIPLQTIHDMNFSSERPVFTKEEYEGLSRQLATSFDKQFGLQA